jgi:parallel beta-helix repeat protein
LGGEKSFRSASFNVIKNNYIGCDKLCEKPIPGQSTGIYLGTKDAHHNIIEENYVVGNDWGIYLDGSVDNTVTKNKVGLTPSGGSLGNAATGISLNSADSNIVTHNNVQNNGFGEEYLLYNDWFFGIWQIKGKYNSYIGNIVVNNKTNSNISNQPPVGKFKLLVISPNGAGRIVSDPQGINCGMKNSSCQMSFSTAGLELMLRATAKSGYYFKSWRNCPNSSNEVCNISLSNPRTTVKAVFSILPKLNIGKTKNGLVTSEPPGITCGLNDDACVIPLSPSTQISLVATPKEGYVFKSWIGCSSATDHVCRITIGQTNLNIRPVFSRAPE